MKLSETVKYSILLITTLLIPSFSASGQQPDTISFTINPRQSFYSYEESCEIIIHVPEIYKSVSLNVSIQDNEQVIGTWMGIPGRKMVRVTVKKPSPQGSHKLVAFISTQQGKKRFQARTTLNVLEYQPNEVKTDCFTGGLIVNRMQYFPFGFYTYTPVHETLPEEEVVKGFNMISPYQKITAGTFHQRKAYMDRCAQLGMKVHYNLLSVSGGGGVNSLIEGISYSEKRRRLTEEIIAFRHHPALLAWYIADEPNGYKTEPDSLEKIYRFIKELDPWHPVSMVFMAPFLSSRKYASSLDIVMADPYPVSDLPVSMVGDVTKRLTDEFKGKKTVWIVPQAFGGGEWWEREPTPQEVRSMTYQSVINGAGGIQYFVRQGLNLFPKSTATWGECGRMAAEIAELTPWLNSDAEAPSVHTGSSTILARTALYDGKLLILAVNNTNSPRKADFRISKPMNKKARVIFENRSINITGGNFSDYLSPYGSQAYIIELSQRSDSLKTWKNNLITDPGLESNTSPGVPDACYARNGGDRGATYFTDSRESVEGNHSIRLVTPVSGGSAKLRFFPFKVRKGARYLISIYAKSDYEQGLKVTKSGKKYFELSLGEFSTRSFELTPEWKEYVTIVTIPFTTDQPVRTNITLQMPSEGVGWFDMLQVAECPDFTKSRNRWFTIEDF